MTSCRRAWRRLALLCLVFLAVIARPAAALRSGGTFVAISDLHFDPFYDPALATKVIAADVSEWRGLFETSTVTAPGSYGKDTSYPLLASAMAALRSLSPKPDFLLVTGDFLAHGFKKSFDTYATDKSEAAYQAFVRKTIAFVSSELRAASHGAPIYPALGNNDSYCGDYSLEPAGPFLSTVRDLWRPLLGRETGTFESTFPLGGYYSVPHPTVRKHRLVVLNSVFFSAKYKNACGQPGSDPGAFELGWLTAVLDEAARQGEKVWLVHHIPPGIDGFATLKAQGACADKAVPFWQAGDLTDFLRATSAHPGRVPATFTGHTHMDEFRLPPTGGLVHGAPGLSPLFGNNPGFQVFTYQKKSGDLLDYKTFFLDLQAPSPRWAVEYSFRKAYGQSAYNTPALEALEQAIAKDPQVRGLYTLHYPVGNPQASSSILAAWKAYWCGITHFTAGDFASCYCAP